ncbi:MAG: hypothetical protein RLZZ546_430 [Bacteroidota bacterium]|jgi:hypothetical protein
MNICRPNYKNWLHFYKSLGNTVSQNSKHNFINQSIFIFIIVKFLINNVSNNSVNEN